MSSSYWHRNETFKEAELAFQALVQGLENTNFVNEEDVFSFLNCASYAMLIAQFQGNYIGQLLVQTLVTRAYLEMCRTNPELSECFKTLFSPFIEQNQTAQNCQDEFQLEDIVIRGIWTDAADVKA